MSDGFANEAIPAPEWTEYVLNDPFNERGGFYNLHHVARLRDDVDLDRFANALTLAVRAQEVSRVRVERSSAGVLTIRDSGVPFADAKVERLPAGSVDAVRREIMRPYEPSDEPFIRLRLARIGDEPWYFECRHHAFYDNLAHYALIEDAVRAYQEPGWVPPPDGFFAWAKREHELLAGPAGEEGRRFWTERRERAGNWPHSPRADRDGSVDYSDEPQKYCFTFPWPGVKIESTAAALGTTVNTLATGAFLRAIAADHGSDRALVAWTCRGRSARTRRLGTALLRDYDIAVETGGDAADFLGRVRAELNAGMRHPYGFSCSRCCLIDPDDTNDDDVSFINIQAAAPNPEVFVSDPRASYGSPSDCNDRFDLSLLLTDGALMSEGVVKYMADYYSSERVRDFMRKFFDELSVFIREANV